jgi:hypothetical protein
MPLSQRHVREHAGITYHWTHGFSQGAISAAAEVSGLDLGEFYGPLTDPLAVCWEGSVMRCIPTFSDRAEAF